MASRALGGCAGIRLGVLVGGACLESGAYQLVEGEAEDGGGSGALLRILGEDRLRGWCWRGSYRVGLVAWWQFPW